MSVGDALSEVLLQALDLAEEGEWEGLATLLREALGEHPDDPYVLCWLGTAERELGMDGVAYERFKRALELAPQDPELLATAGTAIAAFDDPEAEGALRTAALLGPEVAKARLLYGAYLSREGLVLEAIREIDAALALSPDDPLVHLERGVAQALAGDLPSADASFGEASALDPDDGWASILQGLVRIEIGDVEDATPPLEQGARARPDDVEGQLLAALALAAGSADGRALEMVERARLVAVAGDEPLIEEVEARVEEGPDAAVAFLTESLGPSALRERLAERP